jgi:hypothetical protein
MSAQRQFCPLVDDILDEANAVTGQLKSKGFPFLLTPVLPARTTNETYTLLSNARPAAAMLDFRLLEKPKVNVQELAFKLLRHHIPTVFVTKDRNIVDEGDRRVHGVRIPVYHKQRLISDGAYLQSCIAHLGGAPTQTVPTAGDLDARISDLQDKAFLRGLTAAEKAELRTLLARLRLEEREELEAVEKSEVALKHNFNSLISEIRGITRDLRKH